jgi:large subunit ribosomal protein L17
MRHRHKGRSFSRRTAPREAMFRNLMISLIEHGYIQTTLPKAKEVRGFLERLVTIAKREEDSLANIRLVYSRIRNKNAVTKLFKELGPKYKTRPGGYLRILKCGFRAGDNAPLAFVEFV